MAAAVGSRFRGNDEARGGLGETGLRPVYGGEVPAYAGMTVKEGGSDGGGAAACGAGALFPYNDRSRREGRRERERCE